MSYVGQMEKLVGARLEKHVENEEVAATRGKHGNLIKLAIPTHLTALDTRDISVTHLGAAQFTFILFFLILKFREKNNFWECIWKEEESAEDIEYRNI